jgi:hypothetical protein
MKFSNHGENELKLTESERHGAYRLGEARFAQHVQAMTAAKPSHNAIQLTERLNKRIRALQQRDPYLSFSEATQRVINAHPELWAQYCAAQRQE